jgi:hypothetical protein
MTALNKITKVSFCTIQISATDLQFVPFKNIILQKQNIKMVQTW